jgi:hypothetical protein
VAQGYCGWCHAFTADVNAGTYVVRTPNGFARLPEFPINPVPQVVICRRLSDYPQQRPPAAAAMTVCHTCRAPIAFNPNGPHHDRPKICLQCAGIEPLPIKEEP